MLFYILVNIWFYVVVTELVITNTQCYYWNCNYFNIYSSNGVKNYLQGSETLILRIHRGNYLKQNKQTKTSKKTQTHIWLQNLKILHSLICLLNSCLFDERVICYSENLKGWILNSYYKCTVKCILPLFQPHSQFYFMAGGVHLLQGYLMEIFTRNFLNT